MIGFSLHHSYVYSSCPRHEMTACLPTWRVSHTLRYFEILRIWDFIPILSYECSEEYTRGCIFSCVAWWLLCDFVEAQSSKGKDNMAESTTLLLRHLLRCRAGFPRTVHFFPPVRRRFCVLRFFFFYCFWCLWFGGGGWGGGLSALCLTIHYVVHLTGMEDTRFETTLWYLVLQAWLDPAMHTACKDEFRRNPRSQRCCSLVL